MIDTCRSGRELKKINLEDKKNLFSLESKMNVGFVVEHLLKKIKKSYVITIFQINEFKREAQKFIRSMLTKLFERSPLGSFILKSAAIFDPAKLRELPNEKIHARWKMLLNCFIALGILSSQQCDTATTQFKAFIDEKLKMFRADFGGFLRDCFRLDEFYFTLIGVQKYDQLSFVLRLLLTLSHVQAAIERGFSHNSFLLKTNMSAEIVIAKRLIKNHMLSNDLKPHNIDISKSMVKAFKSAHGKYQMHLEDQRQKRISTEAETKAMHLSNEIETLKGKVEQMSKGVAMMDTEVFECVKVAQKKHDISFVIKGNALKRKSDQTKEDILKLKNQIAELEMRKRKLYS